MSRRPASLSRIKKINRGWEDPLRGLTIRRVVLSIDDIHDRALSNVLGYSPVRELSQEEIEEYKKRKQDEQNARDAKNNYT